MRQRQWHGIPIALMAVSAALLIVRDPASTVASSDVAATKSPDQSAVADKLEYPESGVDAELLEDQDGADAEVDECDEDSCEDEEEPATTLLGGAWHQRGPLTAEYLYTGEVFNNARGGISTQGATRYRGNFDLTLRWNTQAAKWWSGGEFFVYAQHSHGTTLTPQFVRDGQYYSNIDTGPGPQELTQLGEYWYKHTFSDERWSAKLGRQDANADFAFADLGGDFVNSSFVTLPNIPMPFWPFQTVGASSFFQYSERWKIAGGLYDSGSDQNQWWIRTADRGLFLIGQVDYTPFAGVEGALTTTIRLGAWQLTNDVYSNDESTVFDHNYGFYGTLDRLLFRETDADEQGLGIFLQASWAPSDRNQVDRHFGGGLTYRGLLSGRDEDTCGVGYTLIDFAGNLNELTGQTFENAIEAFYKYRLTPYSALQPDVQYITHPSGLERDALVTGLRFELTL
jgi:porin